MTNKQSNYPCKCGHLLEAHYEIPEQYGGGWHLDENDREYWEDPQIQPHPVCGDCGPYDCIFEQMTNLEYLEWCYDEKNSSSL